jgi:hypothetical protein
MQESKAEEMNLASVLDGEGTASRMRKGMVAGVGLSAVAVWKSGWGVVGCCWMVVMRGRRGWNLNEG